MEQRNDCAGLLDLMARPAFCAAGGRVTMVNAQAAAFDIAPGMALSGLLLTGAEEYAAFTGGCLYLTLSVSDQQLGAAVTRLADFDVFCLEELADSRELKAMALAAQELRQPLSAIVATAQQLFPVTGQEDDPALRDQVARINRGLYQMLRVLNNMSDAGHYAASPARLETRNITAVLDEIFSKASELVAHSGVRLRYRGHPEAIYCLTDPESLERAALNMISNAIRFCAPGGEIQAALTRRGNKLYLAMENEGDPIPADVFTRYQRQGSVADARFGIGLGMVLIRAAAAAHGGTVLVDQPREGRARVTMSLAIRQNNGMVRSPVLRVDYTGGYSKWLTELSEQLPASLYTEEF